MKLTRLVILFLFLPIACAAPLSPTIFPSPTQPEVAPVALADSSPESDSANGTTLYISATMHIETKFDSWPQDTETFLAFLQQTTDAGIRWSIGGDIGWLEGDSRAQEIVTRSAAMGVEWDVHAHKVEDLAKVASILSAWGAAPTNVVSGMLIADFDTLRQPLTYQGAAWTPQIVWGGVQCPGHREGCDDLSVSIYHPASSADFYADDPNGNLIKIGGGAHTLEGAESLAAVIANGQYNYPVIGYTIMVEPETLRIARSATDDVNAILAFAARMDGYSFVRWQTISETAQAWVRAGSVAFVIQ